MKPICYKPVGKKETPFEFIIWVLIRTFILFLLNDLELFPRGCGRWNNKKIIHFELPVGKWSFVSDKLYKKRQFSAKQSNWSLSAMICPSVIIRKQPPVTKRIEPWVYCYNMHFISLISFPERISFTTLSP